MLQRPLYTETLCPADAGAWAAGQGAAYATWRAGGGTAALPADAQHAEPAHHRRDLQIAGLRTAPAAGDEFRRQSLRPCALRAALQHRAEIADPGARHAERRRGARSRSSRISAARSASSCPTANPCRRSASRCSRCSSPASTRRRAAPANLALAGRGSGIPARSVAHSARRKSPTRSLYARPPTVHGFFDPDTATISYVVIDPATKAAAAHRFCAGFQPGGGAHDDGIGRQADRLRAQGRAPRSTGCWRPISMPITSRAAPYLQSKLGGRHRHRQPCRRGAARLRAHLQRRPISPRDGSQFDQLFPRRRDLQPRVDRRCARHAHARPHAGLHELSHRRCAVRRRHAVHAGLRHRALRLSRAAMRASFIARSRRLFDLAGRDAHVPLPRLPATRRA